MSAAFVVHHFSHSSSSSFSVRTSEPGVLSPVLRRSSSSNAWTVPLICRYWSSVAFVPRSSASRSRLRSFECACSVTVSKVSSSLCTTAIWRVKFAEFFHQCAANPMCHQFFLGLDSKVLDASHERFLVRQEFCQCLCPLLLAALPLGDLAFTGSGWRLLFDDRWCGFGTAEGDTCWWRRTRGRSGQVPQEERRACAVFTLPWLVVTRQR